jgi:ankyrin repeat protein
MSIFDDARNGTLIGARLNNWLKLGTTDLNAQESSSGWTLLATAVASGFPKQVDQLIKRGAEVDRLCRDGETPLLLAAWKTENERPLIVQTLLAQTPTKAIIDTTCAVAENKTPLMYAIERADLESVRLLRKAGASLRIKNDDGFNAEEVAQNTGKKAVLRALYPEKEQSDLARLAANVVTFILFVVAWVDTALNGVMGRAFGITGALHPRTNQVCGDPR